MIDLSVNEEQLKRAVGRAREQRVVLPTFAQMRDPSKIPAETKAKLSQVGLWDIDPVNLFRISWQNEPTAEGGGFGDVNAVELPSSLTGVPARIVCLVGKWFPTGAHKVGATYGCLAPRLVTGQFDPTRQKAVWPSTGNYCRGGAYNSKLLGCESVAILPEEMSQERFDWLKEVADEIIATPGCESNVKEIFDACHELRTSRGDDVMIFNQFEELGNYLWHYSVTGPAFEQALRGIMGPKDRLAGAAFTTGSAGTIGSGDYLKEQFPGCKIAASEALQCPTLLLNGFGGHRIEGIGDKHVPWIHNVRSTDLVMAIDDNACLDLLRLFNEDEGRRYLAGQGVPDPLIEQLDLLGVSGIANVLSAIKVAKWYELDEEDVVVTVWTDSLELYGSRIAELQQAKPEYVAADAAAAYHRWMLGCGRDDTLELGYWERKRVHNLKYFTWVEQQGRSSEELNAQWHDASYWTGIHDQLEDIDRLIEDFNARVAAQ